MNRRQWLVGVLASIGAGCGVRTRHSADAAGHALGSDRVVALSAVRRLRVERTDPLIGRCQYVADLGARKVAQPIIVGRRGEWFDAVVENALPQPTTVHFHGLTLPEAADGAGFDPIAPGATKALQFQIKNRSGLYWFHPHPHGFTAEQVYGGLVGLLVVTDDDDAALDAVLALPPQNRLALAVADARVMGPRLRPYAPSPEECMHGWFGNRALVNGVLDSERVVAPGWVRLQMLNACNARGLLLGFRDGDSVVSFHLFGTDGGLLATPRMLESVFVYTGERVDIGIDLTDRPGVMAMSLEFDPRHQVGSTTVHMRHPARDRYPPLSAESVCVTGSRPNTGDWLPDGAALPLFALRVLGSRKGATASLPSRLSALQDTPAPPSDIARRLRLDFDERSGFLIDQTPYRIDEAGFKVNRGAREVWEIRNSPISMPHPMHLHGFGFRVLRRQGTYGAARALATESGSRLPTDLGIKDTAVVWPNETLWLDVDFTLPEDRAFGGPQRYMFHCHNLEHEDGMMMRNYVVV